MSALGDIWRGKSTPTNEQLLFALGGLLILVHTVDDTWALGEVDLAPTIINAIALVVAALYRLLPWLVVVVAGAFVGVTRLVGGVGHMSSLRDPDPGDYTGFFEALGAVCVFVVVVGVVRRQIALRSRGGMQGSGS